ncbi:hypothetical protein QBC40DRAFT_290403 [Triangularia verruculosa]|uniref:Uncharacterized protein n=1 Tax=Triangularia verruculosa TaxID=2587418 RepID=A0AAN6X6P0_9PEZI|nr:hypothetical protein QBC40DRAFT_290403 [Triangularia verruculosa]
MAHHNRRSLNNKLVANGTAIVNRSPSLTGLVDARPAPRPPSISHNHPTRRTISCNKSKRAAKRHRHESSRSDALINTSAKALLPLLSSLSSLAVHKSGLERARSLLVRQTLSSATAKLLYRRVRHHERATYSYLLKREQWKRSHRRISVRKMSSLNHLSLLAADGPLSDQETVNPTTPSSASSSRSTSPSDSSSSRQQSESVTSVSSAGSSQKSYHEKLEQLEHGKVSTQVNQTDVTTTADATASSAKRKHEETEDDSEPQPKKVAKPIKIVVKQKGTTTPARSPSPPPSPPPSSPGAATDEPPLKSGARASPPPPMTSAVAKSKQMIILKVPSSKPAPPVITPALANGNHHQEIPKQKKLDKGKRKFVVDDDDDDGETDSVPKRAKYTKNTYEGPDKLVQKMEYFERRRHEMLGDPLGYDDLVRHTNKPIPLSTQRKFQRFERHYRHPKPERYEMSGALNPPDMTSALAGGSNKKGEESLSRNARKRAHRKRAEEEAVALRREKSRERTTSGGETEGEEKFIGKGKGVVRDGKGKGTGIDYHTQQQQRKKSVGRQYNGGSD